MALRLQRPHVTAWLMGVINSPRALQVVRLWGGSWNTLALCKACRRNVCETSVGKYLLHMLRGSLPAIPRLMEASQLSSHIAATLIKSFTADAEAITVSMNCNKLSGADCQKPLHINHAGASC